MLVDSGTCVGVWVAGGHCGGAPPTSDAGRNFQAATLESFVAFIPTAALLMPPQLDTHATMLPSR